MTRRGRYGCALAGAALAAPALLCFAFYGPPRLPRVVVVWRS